jgi:hypothetical protein
MGLKEGCVLPAEVTRLDVHESLRWTNQQKRQWQRYEPGQVVTFAPQRDRPAPSATVVRVDRKKVIVALLLGKKSSWICVVPIPSMSRASAKSKWV